MLLPTLIALTDAEQVFGKIKPPEGVEKYDQLAGGGIGLLIFISRIIQIATIVGGIWVFFNFILAGLEYITSNGDTGAHNKVKDKLTMSIIGLVIIVVSYAVMALLGLILTGRADFFLNPQIMGPEGSAGSFSGGGSGAVPDMPSIN